MQQVNHLAQKQSIEITETQIKRHGPLQKSKKMQEEKASLLYVSNNKNTGIV